MNYPEILEKVLQKKDLSFEEAKEVARAIMSGSLTEAQMAGILVALRAKGETPEELAGFATAMREAALKVGPWREALDTAGTGGDKLGTFNASTAAAILASKVTKVAKHGNRSVSSKSGSADFLEALGYNIAVQPSEAESLISSSNFVFLFAQLYHPAMKNVAPVRKSLGVRTIFNLLGPLTNPAGVGRQVIGVFSHAFMDKMAEALSLLKTDFVVLVHGDPGIDEVSVSGPTTLLLVKGDSMESMKVSPEDLKVKRAEITELVVNNSEDSAIRFLRALIGKDGSVRAFIKANLAVALFAARAVRDVYDGAELADQLISEGLDTVRTVISSHGNIEKLTKLMREAEAR